MAANPMAVKLDQETRDRLIKLAEAKRRSPHWLMKEAVREYVEKEERAEKLRHETLDRWETYKTGGGQASNEAMSAWLDTWGHEGETERPSCEK
jgi:predicted transcriptional regulator